MARELASKPNVVAPGGSYPFGRIRDNDGSGNGTPVTEQVYGDIHQFFEKLMNLAGIAFNHLPENQADGFQFISALNKVIDDRISNSGALLHNPLGIGGGLNADNYPAGSIQYASTTDSNVPVAGEVFIVTTISVVPNTRSQSAVQTTGAAQSTTYTRRRSGVSGVWTAWVPNP